MRVEPQDCRCKFRCWQLCVLASILMSQPGCGEANPPLKVGQAVVIEPSTGKATLLLYRTRTGDKIHKAPSPIPEGLVWVPARDYWRPEYAGMFPSKPDETVDEVAEFRFDAPLRAVVTHAGLPVFESVHKDGSLPVHETPEGRSRRRVDIEIAEGAYKGLRGSIIRSGLSVADDR
jgi:hypothetical protein